jgi:hypothetical protein
MLEVFVSMLCFNSCFLVIQIVSNIHKM